ncbi:MAG: DHHW family protein [Bacillota bacterium]
MIRKRTALAILLPLILSLCACGWGTAESISDDEDNVRVVAYEDRVMFVFLNYFSDEEYLANDANALLLALPETLRKYMMISPGRIAFEVEELKSLVADEREAVRYVQEHLDPAIRFVSVYDAMDRYPGSLNDIFFRLDHHWTQLGAYYAAEAFMDAAGVPYRALDEYTKLEGTPFSGYMYLLSGDETLSEFPDPLTYYLLPGNEYKKAYVYYPNDATGGLELKIHRLLDPAREGYALFLGDFGFSHAIIPGNPDSGRALLLIGGSSTYSIAPWFADNFKTVVLIETRFYEGGAAGLKELIAKYGITDAVLCVSFSTRILEFE